MRSSLWPLCLLFALAVPAVEWSAGDTRLALDDGTGQLAELRRGDGPNLLSPTGDAGLWRLVLRRADGTQTTLDPAQAESFSVQADGDGLRLTWRGVRAPGQPDALAVTATVRAGASGKSEWRLEVEGRLAGALWSVEFPRVCGIRSLGASRLAVPLYLGRVVTNPAVNNYSLTLGYPQPASMQAFAYWTLPGDGTPAESPEAETGWLPDESGAEGLYLAAEDGAGHYKQFVVKADRAAGTLSWWVEHIPGLATWPLSTDGEPQRVRYETPYPVVLAAYQGDMQEGAGLYRDWAKDQVWCQRGKLETWPDKVKPGSEEEARWTPPWFRELACWLKFYHEPAKILPEFAAYQAWLHVPMASHWYRYNIAKFDDNYNEMLPGDPYLLQGIQDAKALGVQPLPYINGVIWDTDTQSWHRENGLAAAVKDEAGEFVPWDIHGEIFAYMCPVEQWRAKMRETVRKLVGEHGMSGVYLDCLAATRTMPCYDPSHGHSIRGGNHRAQDNRKLMYDLRADARSYAPEACFFTEEIGETFIDGMDGFLTLDYLRSHCRPGERVFPFFSLIYHPYTINFGSDAAIGQDPDSFRLQMGTLYTWGCQPLLSAIVAKLPEAGEPTSEFLRELVRHFNDIAKPYLTGGEWVPMSVRTPGSPASQRSIDLLVAEHRVEYAKPGKGKRVWTGPAVLAVAWKRGDSLAVTMVNITDQDQTVQLTLPEEMRTGLEHIPAPPAAARAPASGVFTFTVPAGRLHTLAVRRIPALPCPDRSDCRFLQAENGEFPPLSAEQILSAAEVTLVHEAEGEGYRVRAVERRPDGSTVPRTGRTAAETGPKAEGRGLPRRETERPFLLLQKEGSSEAQDGQALAAAGKALYEACLESRQDPKPFVADRPLAQAMERLHALFCARTAMLPLVEIEDDWLSPGFGKTIRLTPAPGYPDRKPDRIEVVPVGDWAKGAVTVTEEVREEDHATNTHTFTLTLNDGLYVERMVPVLFFLTVTRDGHEFKIPEIVRLEANRPVHLIKPRGVVQAVNGREAQAVFTLRNWSPHPVTARLRSGTEGFTTRLEAETVECPPLSDVSVPLRFTARTKAGAHRLPLTVAWADLSEATVVAYAAVDLRDALVPVAEDGDWTPTPADNLATFRREGRMAIHARAGEPIRATIRNVRVTQYTDALKVALRDVDHQIVWQKTIPVDESARLEWTAAMAGAHVLELFPGSGSAVVEIENRAGGELATKTSPVHLFNSPIRRVFHVPAGAREFRFGSRDGGPDETAAVRIVSPTGRIVLDRALTEPSPARPVTIAVQRGEAGKLWQLEVTPRQDISLWLDGEVCPALSPSPQQALRNAE